MATYVVGDIHGRWKRFQKLLRVTEFRPEMDQMWFVGDLVNGPASLEVLRWAREHERCSVVVPGNHDLHMLAVYEGAREQRARDRFSDVLDAPDVDELMEWLAARPLVHRDGQHLLVHAGLPPQWTADDAMMLSEEVREALMGPRRRTVLRAMYGDEPRKWRPTLRGEARLRFAINAFTRMRVVKPKGGLDLMFKGTYREIPKNRWAWFDHPRRRSTDVTVLFGHWSALGSRRWKSNAISLDSGVRWGRELSALRLDDKHFYRV